jgi:soluble lytic murein transglycosylase-like protein
LSELKTSRPYQERFLDGFDRSQLRQEVQKVKPRFGGLRKKYATWALGGALALGGLGVPIARMVSSTTTSGAGARGAPQPTPTQDVTQTIAGDLQTAKQIADQVTGGVQGAVSTVAETATSAPAQVAQQVAAAPQAVVSVADAAAEQIKQAFFAKEVPFGSIIYNEAKRNDIAPELVAAVAHTESQFIPTARSNRGAVGLMQLVPKTGLWLGAKDLTNPTQNIMAGAKYLKYLNDRFNGNQDKVIAAYNAGEGNVRRFNGVPPFRETQNYVQKVLSYQHDLGARLEGQSADLGTAAPGL